MKTILKWRWLVLIVVIALTVGLFLIAPNLSKQAEEAGFSQLSDDASSQLASNLLKSAGSDDQMISLVLKLSDAYSESTKEDVSTIVSDIEAIGKPVDSVLNPTESDELKDQLVSKDGKTVLIPVTIDGDDEAANEVADQIRKSVIPEGMTAYVTGQAIINHDVNASAQEGLEKTEYITVILIFALLLIVFRSIVTPFIPLIAVGITYLLSQSIVAFFIDWFNFPVSNYTQIFLVAILFGIGTDYCILLLSRYKEELTSGKSVEEAIIHTYKTAGRTLAISGIAVFIGFFAIGFAEFQIFKSAVAVAVGIAVLLLVLFTVVPFFMMLLKDKLFWPSKKSASHHDSKLWIGLSKLSVQRPFVSIIVVAIITVPLLFTYDNALSFNTVDEIGDSYESVKGLRAIEDGFGKGDSLPAEVIIHAGDELTTTEIIPYVEELSRTIEKIDGVESVRSMTRPTGEPLEDIYVDRQLKQIADGLGQANEGITGLSKGFDQFGQALQAPPQQQAAGMGQLVQGLQASKDGLNQVGDGLTKTQDILTQMSESNALRETGVFIPDQLLSNEQFQPVIERYSFDDGKGLKLEVILSDDPYSPEAIETIREVKRQTAFAIKQTPLEDATVAYGGISSMNSDLDDISESDFSRTITIMFIGLFIVLAILFRSFLLPIFMMGSLFITYYTSVSVTELIFVNGLGYDGISWAVPFFGFVMLVALGVDYSIFLLDRFREETANGNGFEKAIRISMAKMGTVIMTAAIILAGTFGAMMPSGVLSLVQIATIVIIGLLLYGLVVLPLFIPAIIMTFGNGIWWPFHPKHKKQ